MFPPLRSKGQKGGTPADSALSGYSGKSRVPMRPELRLLTIASEASMRKFCWGSFFPGVLVGNKTGSESVIISLDRKHEQMITRYVTHSLTPPSSQVISVSCMSQHMYMSATEPIGVSTLNLATIISFSKELNKYHVQI
jgi:hypothetical protein